MDLFDEPTKLEKISYIPWRLWYKIESFFWATIYYFQRKFRGWSERDIFEMYAELTHIILPRLIEYKKNKHGYPSIFCEWDESQGKYGGLGMTKKQYNKALKDKTILGGGDKAWDEIIDKMIFAFTYILSEDSYPRNRREKKLVKQFKEQYGDVWEKKEENKQISEYHLFNHPNGSILQCPQENFSEKVKNQYIKEGYLYMGFKQSKPFYHNYKLDEKFMDQCQQGLNLFGKYFRSLWD